MALRPLLLPLALCCAPASPMSTAIDSHTLSLQRRFDEWKAEHQQSYASATEEANARRNFADTDARIEAHNRAVADRRSTYTLGHNQFSGLTDQAFMAAYALADPMSRPDFPVGERAAADDTRLALAVRAPAAAVAPTSFDWQQHGAVGPVQQQGTCGACYAFSVVAAMEGALAISTRRPFVKLSEMDVIECASPPNVLCAGGDLYRTYQWMQWAGVSNETYYPYTAAGGGASACDQKRWEHQTAWNVGGVFGFAGGANESAMLAALALQPLSAAINPRMIMNYKGGIFDNKNCDADLQHAVLITGWGTENGTDYWVSTGGTTTMRLSG